VNENVSSVTIICALVSLYAPLLDSTYHMINKEALDKMKQGAMLVNTSRGGLVDAKALVECLKSGKLRGAALDVYEFEKQYFFNDYSQQVSSFLRRRISRSFDSDCIRLGDGR
jgi:D-lactate dehydrogenase